MRQFYGRLENAFFLQEKRIFSIKFLVLGGGYFGCLGGGECRFYFYGRADFSETSVLPVLPQKLIVVFYFSQGNLAGFFLDRANGSGGFGSQTAAGPPPRPLITPEKEPLGTVTSSHKRLTLQALSSSLNASAAKVLCLGRGEDLGAL